MAVPNEQNLNPEHISLYKEARNFIFDYTTHNYSYQKSLIDRLIKPGEIYVLYPIKTIVYYLVKLSPPPNLLFGAKPPFSYEKIHPFLRYFGSKDVYNRLNDIAAGKFKALPDKEEVEIASFNKLPEDQKDKKINREISKKTGGKIFGFVSIPTLKPPQQYPKVNIKPLAVPSFIKNLGVWSLIKVSNLINRHPKISVPLSVGMIVGFIQYVVTGNPAVGWISGILTSAGVHIASQYLSAPRQPQQIGDEDKQYNSGGWTGGGGVGGGSFQPPWRSKTSRALGRGLGKAGARAAGGLAKAAVPLLANPITWVVIGIIFFILLFFFLIFNKNTSLFNPVEEDAVPTATSSAQLKISKTAPGAVPNGSPIPYEITVTYIGTGTADITVTDKLPDNTDFTSSNPAATPDANRILTWNFPKIQPNQPQKVSFVIQPNKNDIYVQNTDYGAKITGVTGGGGGEIAACTFFREGDTTVTGGVSGLKFNIPEWPALINEVTLKVGVPASFIAGFLRVECPDCFATSDPSYIINDYDGHSSGVAYGAMQFTPGTFEEVFKNHKDELRDKFGKTSFTLNIDPGDRNNPNSSVFRMYSVKDSVVAASFKARDDSGGVFDEAGVRKAVKAYYGSCIYDQGGQEWNYCSDVWNSVSSCHP
ncbi:hypothetical protein HYW46_06820 [Candidatus Daviesbacteria bacterium]|nr:hypothetical protein [Candidatus Daviesbacteria bacterium]